MYHEHSLASRFLFFILIVLLLLTLRFVTPFDMKGKVLEDQMLLFQLMEKSGANMESVTINYGNMIMEGIPKDDILSTKEKLDQLFSINLVQVSKPEQNDVMKYQVETPIDEYTTLRVIWVGNQPNPNTTYDGYLLIDVISKQVNRKRISELSTFMFNKLRELSIEPTLNTSLEGYLQGKMNVDEQSQLIRSIFASISVTNIEGTKQNTLVSYSGYSKRFHRYVTGGGKQMNIQAATHVDHLTGRTKVTIGSPLITVDI
jgi:hypothetical protein